MPVVEDLLADTSWADLGVEHLISQAGVSRSRFYVHFEDKGDLLAALAVDTVTDLFEHTLGWWSLPAEGTFDDLVRITDELVATFLAHRRLLAAVVETSISDARVRDMFNTPYQQAVDRYVQALVDQQASGLVDPRLDARRTVLLLTRMTEEGFYHLLGNGEPDRREKLTHALAAVIWKTLYERTRGE